MWSLSDWLKRHGFLMIFWSWSHTDQTSWISALGLKVHSYLSTSYLRWYHTYPEVSRYIDPEYVCCTRLWHVQQQFHTVPSFTWFFWEIFPGMRPWRNWRSRRANVDLALLKRRRNRILVERKVASNGKDGKRGWAKRHFCWAHLMHLATGNREP